jgi:hypothetical protein
MDMVYRKALRLNSGDVAERGVGGIVNLQSNDVKKLERLPITMHGIWEGPLQVLFVPLDHGSRTPYVLIIAA